MDCRPAAQRGSAVQHDRQRGWQAGSWRLPEEMQRLLGSTECPGRMQRSSRRAMAAWNSGMPFILQAGQAGGEGGST